MNRPHRHIVIAYHLIWTAYGWWLPNDLRGSTSHQIACDAIAELGELHHGRRKVQPAGWVIRDFYQRATEVLKHALMTFRPDEIQRIARAFGSLADGRPFTCHACAVMADHVHVLMRKHKRTAERMIADLQDASRVELQEQPDWQDHPIWGGPGWKVFLYSPDEVRRTIRYIANNPVKMGLPRQEWDFVAEYDGWPLHKRNR